ncbi:MAG: DUF748 domain-containing protein, partial [Candidatus Binataceae bacterium]|nr:DUF748 domain-containing protein [Candidatus Binataceae bacterium]
ARGTPQPFVDITQINLQISWKTVFKLVPIIKEVTIEGPKIHLVRSAPQTFNFSDLMQSSPNAPANKKPTSFAVANIQVDKGTIELDDKVTGQHHRIESLQLDLPFIANLPADINIFVQPLLQMNVDGSPLRVAGVSKPFGATRESIIYLNLKQLDLHRYFDYVPAKLPIKLPQGTLSAGLKVFFIEQKDHPMVRLTGDAAIDNLAINDSTDAKLLELKHFDMTMADVEPLENLFHLAAVKVDGLTPHLTLNPDRTTNLTAILAGVSGKQSAQSASAAPVPPAVSAAAAKAKSAAILILDNFQLNNSSIEITDRLNPKPAVLAINAVHVGLTKLATNSQTPASFEMTAALGGGGNAAAKGTLDLPASEVRTQISLDQVNLPAFQPLLPQAFANDQLTSGKLQLQANLRTLFASGKSNLLVDSAKLSLNDVQLKSVKDNQTPISWKQFSTSIAKADLSAHTATIDEVRSDGINLAVQRGPHGQLNLLALIPDGNRNPPSPSTGPGTAAGQQPTATSSAASTPAAAGAWQYRIASVALENTTLNLEDHSGPKRVTMMVTPLNIHLKDVTENLAKPFNLIVDGKVNRRGSFNVAGDAAVKPLRAKLHIDTHMLNLAPIDPLITSSFNATIASAALTSNGELWAQEQANQIQANYRGDALLGGVKVLDKVTGDSFLRWYSLDARHIDVGYGKGSPRAHVGSIALSNFYARVILNHDGRLNLNDIMTNPNAAPVSLTRAHNAAAAPAPSGVSNVPAARPLETDFKIGGTTLHAGRIDYSDNFIRPNYSANLSQIGGHIGAFGSRDTAPADVLIEGKINRTSPIRISGSMSPLAPLASLDIRAKANDIEMAGLSTYSTKYTGYPITGGTLTANVHYLLKDEKLTAHNHIRLDQLTFGKHVNNSTATNLPLRLAVSILKDPQGRINLNVPVSGSLSDPEFSLGKMIVSAFKTIIMNAVTAPFSLLASAIGGSDNQQLSFIAFDPGFATLTAASKNKLTTLAKALKQRPAVKLQITGRVDPSVDRSGLRNAILLDAIKRQKVKSEGGPSDTDLDKVELTPDEYGRYLTRVYKAADFPKPRDLVGLAKSLPPDEMKKLIITNTKVTDQDLRNLAEARAAAVQTFLSKTIDRSRLVIAAPKLDANGIADRSKTARVDLSLN